MSVLSRTSLRRGASMASVFVVAVFIVGIMATPALAQSTCAVATTTLANDTLNVAVGTDDTVVLADFGAGFVFSENGGAFVACTGAPTQATVSWINVTGSNAGNETLNLFRADDYTNSGPTGNVSITVDLGNGNDTLIWEYGALVAPPVADDDAANTACLGAAAGVVLVGDQNCGGVADIRVNNAEVFTVNTGGGDDLIDAGNLSGIDPNDPVANTAADNIPGSTAPANVNFTLNGGNGGDLLVSGDGDDNFQGGPGQDAVSYEAAASAVTVDLAAATGTGMGADTLADVQDVFGSVNDDTLLGNALDNNIQGNDGDDTIDGREGNDGGTAGVWVDTGLNGDDGDDSLTGGTGNDLVEGDAGDDVVNEDAAANGTDSLRGGPGGGCDEINYGLRTTDVTVNEKTETGWGAAGEADTGQGFEVLRTGTGNDTLVGDDSSEQFIPGAGNDIVDGNGDGGPNPCGLGNVFTLGGDYLDLSGVAGPAVFNLITGEATGDGTDSMEDLEGYIGTAGDDTVVVGDTTANGNTLVNFAADGGIDLVDGSTGTVNQTIDLFEFGFDCTLANGCFEVENANGGSGNDFLGGNQLNNLLVGNDGVDIINGLGGNDKIEGGLGNDLLDGGVGGDTLSYRHATGGMEINARLGFTNGPDGSDSILNFEIYLGSNFNDQITGGQSSIDIPNKFKGFKGNDTLTGTNSTDTLLGGGGNDTIRAGGGDDLAKGAGGNDLLLGANGNDVLTGGGGRDRANGQQGFDVCKAEREQNCEA